MKELFGKVLTLSIMIDDDTIYSVTFSMPVKPGSENFASPGVDIGSGVIVALVLFWDQQSYQLCRITLGPSATIRIKKIKLEVGTVSTLKNEVVDYAAELRKCQRYFWRLKSASSNNYAILTTGFMHDSTQFRTVVKFPETIRIAPTISKHGKLKITSGGTIETSTVATLDRQSFNGDSVVLTAFTSTAFTNLDRIFYLQADNDVAAYIDFSVEL